MKINRAKNAGRNVVFGMFLKIYQIFVPFIMRTVILYCMGEKYLGLNSLFSSILQVLNLAELGVGSAMVYSMYKPIAENDTQTISALVRLYRIYYHCIGGVIAVLGLLLIPILPNLIHGDIPAGINITVLYLLNLAATVLSYWLFAYKNSLLQAHQRDDVASKVMIVTTTIQYGLQAFILFSLKDYYLYVLVMLATQAITNIVTAAIVDKMYPEYRPKGNLPREYVRKINGRIRDLFTAKLGGTLVNSGDTVIISAFLGLTPLAIYQNYSYIMKSVISLVVILFTACTAGIGNSLVTETIDKNYNDFKKFNLLISWISTIAVSCFICLYQPFMLLWTQRKDFLLPMGCVVLFGIYFHVYILQQLSATYKDAGGIWHEDRFRPLCSAIVNLLLNLILVKRYGVYAIILATIISYLFVAMPWLTHNLFSIMFKRSPKEYIFKNFVYAVVIVLAAASCYFITTFLPNCGILTIILRLLVCFFISNMFFVVSFRRMSEFGQVIVLIDIMTHYRFAFITKKLIYHKE